MIDKAHFDLTGADCLDDGCIAFKGDGVIGLDAFQPFARLFLAPAQAHGSHHRLKGGVGWRPANPVCPLWVRKIPDVGWQVGFGQAIGVVDNDARPTRDADPRTICRTKLGFDLIQNIIG